MVSVNKINSEQNRQWLSRGATAAVIGASAIAITVLALKGRAKGKMIKNMQGQIEALTEHRDGLQTSLHNLEYHYGNLSKECCVLKKTNSSFALNLTKAEELNLSLTRELSGVKEVNSRLAGKLECAGEKEFLLTEELTQTKTRLKEMELAPLSESRILSEMQGKAKLNYDAMTPPVIGKVDVSGRSYKYTLPDSVGTNLRSHIKKINLPEITETGKFEFKMPESAEMKISKIQSMEFTPQHNVSTSISEAYADSVQWDNDKIARDILQNFFDGHGQTLDGVKFKFEPIEGGKFKIRIDGQSTYTPDKAVYIGESTKRNNANAAGNFGEGIKMASLKLLRDKGAENVKIGSDNWVLNYLLKKGNLSEKRVLTYDLEKVANYDGNFIEFVTDDKELLQSMRKSIDRFYHSGNEHFRCPEFENDTFGIKLLADRNEKGALYIAGQRFEFEGDYDGLKGTVLYLKEKPPVAVLDPSRDRTSINRSQLNCIANWLTEYRTTEEEKLKVIKTLDPYIDKVPVGKEQAMDTFLDIFIFNSDMGKHPIKGSSVFFPEKFVAYTDCSEDIQRELLDAGYRICKSRFAQLGMPTIKELYGEARKHIPVQPTEIQEKKMVILKEALNRLAPSLEGKHFTPLELDSKIFLFDKLAAGENSMYADCAAEAIVDGGKSLGFWIDKSYLDGASFSEVLETALHELSHKAGGDGSSAFSYKLTNVNKDVLGQLFNNPKTSHEFKALNSLWESVSNSELPVLSIVG